jgi:hypothetical protein
MRRDFGSSATDAPSKLTIEVATDGLPEGYALNSAKRTITVSSPTLLSVPVEMTATTVFYQSVVYPLASLVVADLVDHYPGRWYLPFVMWEPLIRALRLWGLWEDNGPLAVGHDEVVHWLYQNAQAAGLDARQALPAGYERLCRTYRVWGVSPEDMFIPLNCKELGESQRAPMVSPALATWLVELTYVAGYHMGDVPPIKAASRVVALETVIEYIVAIYGRDHLPRLIAALPAHTSWHTLVPAVFGVSADEFETGWQVYLATHYGIDETR